MQRSILRSAMSTPSSSPFFLSHFSLSSPPSAILKPYSLSSLPFEPLTTHRSLKFSAINSTSNQPPPPPTDIPSSVPPPLSLSSDVGATEKRSFAVATGELFLGIASLLTGRSRSNSPISVESESSVAEVPRVAEEEAEGGERIAAVIEDTIEPGVLWEQREKDVEAEKRRKSVTSPGFSFSAAGLLFPYHLGVAQFLLDHGYIKETTPLAGSSAGAIICAVIASGKSVQDAVEATKILAEDCRLRGTAFRLGAVLRDVLVKVLPDDIHIRCNGRVRVAVTQLVWRPRGLLIDQFDSKEDLIDALFTSSFIPGYLAPRPATMFRNRLCIDGGLTLFMPPTSAPQTVRVCAFPASSLRFQGIGISPDCNPANRPTNRQLFNWALEPADDHVLDQLFESGYSDARVWAQENPMHLVVQEETPILQDV